MRTRTTLPTCSSLIVGGLCPPVEEGEALFEIERRRDAFEREPELHHGQGHFRLDPDDHRFGPPQFRGVGNAAKRARRERVEYVERGNVDDHTASAVAAHEVGKVVTELQQVAITQRRLDTGDQRVTLFENRNGHTSPRAGKANTSGRHVSPRGGAPVPTANRSGLCGCTDQRLRGVPSSTRTTL